MCHVYIHVYLTGLLSLSCILMFPARALLLQSCRFQLISNEWRLNLHMFTQMSLIMNILSLCHLLFNSYSVVFMTFSRPVKIKWRDLNFFENSWRHDELNHFSSSSSSCKLKSSDVWERFFQKWVSLQICIVVWECFIFAQLPLRSLFFDCASFLPELRAVPIFFFFLSPSHSSNFILLPV